MYVKAVAVFSYFYKLECKSVMLFEFWNSSSSIWKALSLLKLECSQCWQGAVSLRLCRFPRARTCSRSLFLPLAVRGPGAQPARPGGGPQHPVRQASQQAGRNGERGGVFWYLLWFWWRALYTCSFAILNVSSRKMRGAITLRWLGATSCAQDRLCQLWHHGTCCQLSSGWKAQIGPDLASA